MHAMQCKINLLYVCMCMECIYCRYCIVFMSWALWIAWLVCVSSSCMKFMCKQCEYILFLSVPVAGRCRPVPAGAGPYTSIYAWKVRPVAGRCRSRPAGAGAGRCRWAAGACGFGPCVYGRCTRWPVGAGGRPVPVAGRFRWPAGAGRRWRCWPVPGRVRLYRAGAPGGRPAVRCRWPQKVRRLAGAGGQPVPLGKFKY